MIFYSILFYLILHFHEDLGLLQIDSDIKNECSVRLETENGIETCLNLQCSDYKDPLRILASHNQDQPCYFHYLKLTFTSYDQLLVLIELQTTMNKSLGEFFDQRDTELCMLEIEIDTIYPFNEEYFLSENMLNKLNGKERNIQILLIEIKRWYISSRTVVQVIANDLIHKQPFEQITILFKCYINHRIEEIILAKYNQYQERSTCPTQIFISPPLDSSKSDEQESEEFHRKSFVNEFNLSNSSINQSNFIFNKEKTTDQWNMMSKIVIIGILILVIIVCVISCLIYSYFQSTNDKNET